ncbi:MAG: SRPBCC domain-containing protein [Pseudomonadota bacterium]
MDSVFKALADASRRDLLDALRQEDGQTLSQLEAASPLSRFGVAKHLNVLEAAGLVTRVKRGRFTHHYLNAVPLAEALGRWIEPFSVAPAVRGVLDLKARLEGDMEPKPDFVMSTYIRCTQDALWTALTDAEEMGAWHFLASTVRRDGEVYEYDRPSGETMMTCRTLEADPKRRLVTTFELHGEGVGAPSRVVYLLAPEGDNCRLTLEHYDLTFPVIPGQGVADGWERWAAGLKTWLETGQGVRFAQDAMA